MEQELNKKCRSCLTIGAKMSPLNTKIEGCNDNSTYGKFLLETVKSEIPDDYELFMPQYICIICCKALRNSFTFIRQAQRSHETLMSLIDDRLLRTSREPEYVANHSIMRKENYVEGDGVNHRNIKVNGTNIKSNSFTLPSAKLIKPKHTSKKGEEFPDRNDSIDLPIQHIEIRGTDGVKHIFIENTETESNIFPCIKSEIDLSNGSFDEQFENSEDCEDNEQSIISEIKIEETQIGNNIENISMESNHEWLQCNLCPRKYKKQCHYTAHLKRAHGISKENGKRRKNNAVKCLSCDYIAKNSSDMYYHKHRYHSTSEDKIKCQFCSYENTIRSKLFYHIKNNHKEIIKNLKAETRKGRGERNIDLTQNQMKENNEPSSDEEFIKNMLSIRRKKSQNQTKSKQCNECGKICGTSHALYSHKQKHKTEEEKIPCQQCERKFKRTYELTKHIKLAHNSEKRIKLKRFRCQHCSFATDTSTKLHIHIKQDHTERPFKCDICSKTFLRKYDLDAHFNLHSGITFKCDICSKSFARKRVMLLHKRRHTIEKQTCKDCGRAVKHLSEHKRYSCRKKKLN